MTSAASPEVVLLFRLRDEMSAGLAQVNQRLDQTQRSAERSGQAFRRGKDDLANYSRNLLLFGATALTVAASIARLGAQFGLLNEEQEKNVTTIISTIGALSALAGGLARLIPLIIAIARAERTRAIVSAFASTATIPVVGVALAFVAAGLAAAYLSGIIGSHQMGTGQRHQVPGATTQGRLAMVHGGETISRPSSGGGGGDNTINLVVNGSLMGSETEARNFAKKIGRYLQEGNRTGWLHT